MILGFVGVGFVAYRRENTIAPSLVSNISYQFVGIIGGDMGGIRHQIKDGWNE